ncbi:TVP38/TMEM64 family protein [Ferviditalea candida]|uniref:TVP38/TMEM64 family membrane protein n=1 Tax=Ferviditalea candida TaxID=3108399 RepID=A0ABU5ZN02_9BACL|nr:TVP38/TMEM64 family protein [Paenibacillaceae bacterium T2]
MGSFGTLSVFFGMLAVFGQTFFPYLPFVVVAGANVLMFGMFWGFVINYSMSILGAFASFLFARYLARDWVDSRLQKYPQISLFKRNIEKNGFIYILIGRLIPVLPSTFVNWGSGLSRLSWGPFLGATMIGKLPVVFLESLIGHDLLHFKEHKERLLLLILIFLLLVGAGSWMKKKTVRNQNQNQ